MKVYRTEDGKGFLNVHIERRLIDGAKVQAVTAREKLNEYISRLIERDLKDSKRKGAA